MSALDYLYRIKFLCRICLSNSKNNICLYQPLNEKKNSPSILQALERIVTVKVKLNDNYFPNLICPTCLSSVNSSHKLIEQFENTQKQLNIHFYKSNLDQIVIKNEADFANNTESNMSLEDTISQNSDSVIICDEENMEYIEYTDAESLDDYLVFNSKQENVEIHEEYVEYIGRNKNVYDSSDKCKNPQFEELELEIGRNYGKRSKTKFSTVNDFIIEKDDFVKLNSTSQVDDELFEAASNFMYSCTSCPKVYSLLKNLERHKKKCVQTIETAIAEQKIDKQDITLDSLSQVDQELFKSALLLKYECERCSKIYSSMERLKKHQTVCRSYKPFKNKTHCKRNGIQINVDGLLANINKSETIDSIEQVSAKNLSQIEKDIFKSAFKLRHKCIYCHNFFSSEVRYNKHIQNCRAKKKLGIKLSQIDNLSQNGNTQKLF